MLIWGLLSLLFYSLCSLFPFSSLWLVWLCLFHSLCLPVGRCCLYCLSMELGIFLSVIGSLPFSLCLPPFLTPAFCSGCGCCCCCFYDAFSIDGVSIEDAQIKNWVSVRGEIMVARQCLHSAPCSGLSQTLATLCSDTYDGEETEWCSQTSL